MMVVGVGLVGETVVEVVVEVVAAAVLGRTMQICIPSCTISFTGGGKFSGTRESEWMISE